MKCCAIGVGNEFEDAFVVTALSVKVFEDGLDVIHESRGVGENGFVNVLIDVSFDFAFLLHNRHIGAVDVPTLNLFVIEELASDEEVGGYGTQEGHKCSLNFD